MSILGKILGSDKALDSADNLVNKVSTGIDKSVLTNEEVIDYKLSFLKAYEPFKLAQRLIALIVIPSFIFIVFLIIGLYIFGMVDMGDLIFELAKETLATPFLVIISFYYAGGMLEGVVSKYKEKTKK